MSFPPRLLELQIGLMVRLVSKLLGGSFASATECLFFCTPFKRPSKQQRLQLKKGAQWRKRMCCVTLAMNDASLFASERNRAG